MVSDADLAILVPVLNRPHRVAPTLESAQAATPNAAVLFIADPDDDDELLALKQAGARYMIRAGNYAEKINYAAAHFDRPMLLLGADDLHFHVGWFERAARRLKGDVAVVGTNDLCNRRTQTGELATHPLVARWYLDVGTADETGKLLHEGYRHEFVDQEFTETALARGVYAHATDAIVEHLHPDAGKAPMDSLYAARPARMRQGRKLYRRRRPLWVSP